MADAWREPLALKVPGCVLRAWRPGDEAALVRYANNRNVSRNLKDRFPFPYTAADAESWIERAGAQNPPTTFAIALDDGVVGGVGVDLGADVFRR